MLFDMGHIREVSRVEVQPGGTSQCGEAGKKLAVGSWAGPGFWSVRAWVQEENGPNTCFNLIAISYHAQ